MKKFLKLILVAVMVSGGAYAAAQSATRDSGQNQMRGQDKSAIQLEKLNRSQVRELQRALSSRGYILSVDGVVGYRTRSALKEFQRDAGLTANGNLTAETMDQLNLRQNVEFERLPAGREEKQRTHDTMMKDSDRGMGDMDQDSDTTEEPQIDDTDQSDEY